MAAWRILHPFGALVVPIHVNLTSGRCNLSMNGATWRRDRVRLSACTSAAMTTVDKSRRCVFCRDLGINKIVNFSSVALFIVYALSNR